MNGREKLIAAFSQDGTASTPLVVCYPDIFLRDHWEQVTDEPWWSGYRGDVKTDLRVIRDRQRVTGEDRVRLRLSHSRADRERYSVRVEGERAYLVDTADGTEKPIERPSDRPAQRHVSVSENRPVTSREQVDTLLRLREVHDPKNLAADGRDELPRRILAEFGRTHMPWVQLPAALNPLPFCWGFESFMLACLERPELVHYAAAKVQENTLRAFEMWRALGVELIWIEDCLTDQISPAQYERLALPYLQEMTAAFRRAGAYSIIYFCGNPNDRLEMLLQSGADALSLEEGKKDFEIDIMDVAERVGGRTVLLGNIDAIGVMERGTMAAVRAEVERQLEAGKRNRGRFILGYGSPITPATPAGRVRAVADMLHEMAP